MKWMATMMWAMPTIATGITVLRTRRIPMSVSYTSLIRLLPKQARCHRLPECCTCNSSVAYVYNYNIDDVNVVPVSLLPVRLTSFTAHTNTQHKVDLQWQTASEHNACEYDIQKLNSSGSF